MIDSGKTISIDFNGNVHIMLQAIERSYKKWTMYSNYKN